MRAAAHLFRALFGAAFLLTVACSGGQIAVGRADQAVVTKLDGGPTGDGKTCSWEGTAAYATASVSGTSGNAPPLVVGPYQPGDSFKSLDACNDCTCTERGIMCTVRTCTSGGDGASDGAPPDPVKPPNPIDPSRYSQRCSTSEDCVLVITGNVCAPCSCPNAAIAKSAASQHESDYRASASQCPKADDIVCAPCQPLKAECTAGACTVVPGP